MHGRFNHRLLLVALALIAAAIVPATASASSYYDHEAIKSTKITSPADPTFRITDDVYDRGGDEGYMEIKGTSVVDPAWLAATDSEETPGYVDIRCYRDGDYDYIEGEVEVQRDGTFEDEVYLGEFEDGTCRLRALPGGDSVGDLSKFEGPVVGITGHDTYSICWFLCRAGAEARRADLDLDEIASFESYTEQRQGTWALEPAGECAVDGSDLYLGQNFKELDSSVFDCAGGIEHDSEWDDLDATVDGMHALLVGEDLDGLLDLSTESLLGLTTAAVDPANGNFDLGETQKLRLCADEDGRLPDNVDYEGCNQAVDSGLTVRRGIETASEGRQAIFTDTYTNTSSSPKALKTGYYNDSFGDASPRYAIGDGAAIPHDEFDIETFDHSPATVSIDQQAVDYDDEYYGCPPFCIILDRDAQDRGGDCCGDDSEEAVSGAVTYTPAPDRAIWDDDDSYTALYERTIAPGQSVSIKQVFTQGVDADDVRGLTRALEDKAGAPSIAITAPGVGTTTQEGTIVATGTASDDTGVSSVAVNGASVPVAGDGRWSAPITLAPGVNTITAVARDAAGNEGQATRAVVYAPVAPVVERLVGPAPAVPTCTVPRVHRRTLLSGERALVRAGCAVGTLKKQSSKTREKGRIISQSRSAGARVPVGTKVNLVVSSGKPKATKSRAKSRSKKAAKRR